MPDWMSIASDQAGSRAHLQVPLCARQRPFPVQLFRQGSGGAGIERHLEFGRIAASEREVPNMLANLV